MLEDGASPVLVRFPWSSDEAVERMARDYAPGRVEPPAEQPPAEVARPIGFATGSPSGAGLGVAYEPPPPAPQAGSGKGEKWAAVEAELDRLEEAGVDPVTGEVAKVAGCSARYVRNVLEDRRKRREGGESGAEVGRNCPAEGGSPGRNEVPEGEPISSVKSSQDETFAVLDELWSLPAFEGSTGDADRGGA